MTCETLNIGPVPAEEDCAQLGVTDLFERANRLELLCYRAALTACHGEPPNGAAFRIERNAHDFGTYRELVVRYDPDDEIAAAWAFGVENGLGRWVDADFRPPVIYDARSQVDEFVYVDHFAAARCAMARLERLRIDGLATVTQASHLANLRAAYPAQTQDADRQSGQLASPNIEP